MDAGTVCHKQGSKQSLESAEDSLPGLKEVPNIRAPEELLRLDDLLLHKLILQFQKCLLPCDGLPCPQAVFQAQSLFIFYFRSHSRAPFALHMNRCQHLATPFLIASRTTCTVSLLSHSVAHLSTSPALLQDGLQHFIIQCQQAMLRLTVFRPRFFARSSTMIAL